MDSGDVPKQDPLTGVGRRDGLFRDLEHALGDVIRTSARVALLLLDLDDLKMFNDEHGHGAGDAALQAIAGRLLEVTGPNGSVYRIGGDEFVVLHQGEFGRAGAMSFADSVPQAVKAPFPRLDVPGPAAHIAGFHLTCTIGFALSAHGSTGMGLLQRADEAMSHGKKHGPRSERGDCCVLFGDLPTEEITIPLNRWGDGLP